MNLPPKYFLGKIRKEMKKVYGPKLTVATQICILVSFVEKLLRHNYYYATDVLCPPLCNICSVFSLLNQD
jgi:hypothetical protein